MFRALSDPTRVEIVQLVSKSPRNVTELTSLVGVSQPKVSRHLKILRDAGLVSDVRRGRWVWYEMAGRSGGEPASALATAMSVLFHGGSTAEWAGVMSARVASAPAGKPTTKTTGGAKPAPPARKRAPASKPARRPAQASAPAPKPAPKQARKEASAARPAASGPAAKDIEDFLL